MSDQEDHKVILDTVSKYYEYTSYENGEDTLTLRVPEFHLQPEQNFIKLSRELDKLGYLSFTSTGDVDEIIVMHKPVRKTKNDSRIKLVLLATTIAFALYYGYQYQVNYQGNGYFLGNLATSLLFYMLPLSVILAGREAAKYVAMKKNGMQYPLPLFIPNPLGIGSMGMINSPNRPYVSKRAMIESGGYSIIAGFLISLVFLIIGSLTTYNFPPSAPIVNSQVQTVGSPLVLQFLANPLIPSNGILDPLAMAGWAGIVITAFNALPLGFLDGGLISAALFGRRSIYLSYLSLVVIIGLSVIYTPWIILAVFALLVGLKGPQPLNNITGIRMNTKAIAGVAFAIIILGLAPFPLHTSTNSFNVDVTQQYFLLYNGGQNSINFNVSVNNTGQSTIVPAFEISPTVGYNMSGESRSIAPGGHVNYSLKIDAPNNMPLGFNNYALTVYSGNYFSTVDLSMFKVNTSSLMEFNNYNPFTMKPNQNGSISLALTSNEPENIHIVSIGGPNISFSYYLPNELSKITYNSNLAYLLLSPTPTSTFTIEPGNATIINLSLNSSPQYWYIVAFNQNYTAAIAQYET